MGIISKYFTDFESTNLQENKETFFLKFGSAEIFNHTAEVVMEVERLALKYDLGRVVNHEEMVDLCSLFG